MKTLVIKLDKKKQEQLDKHYYEAEECSVCASEMKRGGGEKGAVIQPQTEYSMYRGLRVAVFCNFCLGAFKKAYGARVELGRKRRALA